MINSLDEAAQQVMMWRRQAAHWKGRATKLIKDLAAQQDAVERLMESKQEIVLHQYQEAEAARELVEEAKTRVRVAVILLRDIKNKLQDLNLRHDIDQTIGALERPLRGEKQ